jgi:hypothetical protein
MIEHIEETSPFMNQIIYFKMYVQPFEAEARLNNI